MDLPTSKLRFFSLGIVTKDKAVNSDDILVTAIEDNPQLEGYVQETKKQLQVTAPDAKGIERAATVTAKATIPAKWLPFAVSNRITAPDVYEGETVMILQFADEAEYYWVTLMREPKLRRLENVIYGFSNVIKEAFGKAFDKASSYWFQVSTRDKIVKLYTAKNDGEPTAYDIEINTRTATITIKDDFGNIAKLDSQKGIMRFKSNKAHIIDVPKTYITKDLLVGGSIYASGGIAAKGGMYSPGGMSMGGDLQVMGRATVNGAITTATPITAPTVNTGSGSTSVKPVDINTTPPNV